MEERQTQIREAAGLEEAKLNVEFIDFLRRWSTPAMGLIALVALGFVVSARIDKSRAASVDRAFDEFAAATSQANVNPETLKTLASENAGIRGIPLMAEMEAADIYLDAGRTGVKVGAKRDQSGAVAADEIMTEEQRVAALADAEKLYQKILDKTGTDKKKAIHALGAAYGLAAVAECRGNMDAAKASYERAATIAENAGFKPQAAVAKKRIENLPKLSEAPKLLSSADLPKPPEVPKANAPDLGNAPLFKPSPDAVPNAPAPTEGATGSTGATGTSPAPDTTPAPAPKPTEPAPATPPAEPKPADPK